MSHYQDTTLFPSDREAKIYLYLNPILKLMDDNGNSIIPNDKNLKQLIIHGGDVKIPFIINDKSVIPDNIEHIKVYYGSNVRFCVGNKCSLGNNVKSVEFERFQDLVNNLGEMYLWPDQITLKCVNKSELIKQVRTGDEHIQTVTLCNKLRDYGIIRIIKLLYSTLPLPIYEEVIEYVDLWDLESNRFVYINHI